SGSGKTWLIEELGRRAIQRGCWVLRGQGLAQVAQRPLHVLSQMARDITATAGSASARRARLLERASAVPSLVTELLPELRWMSGAADADRPDPLDTAEARSLAALTVLLDALGSEAEPAVVVIDDAQWADALTLRLLERWQEDARATHTLIVLAF